jgi:cytoskeletal protein CcmA (bactofilin family)
MYTPRQVSDGSDDGRGPGSLPEFDLPEGVSSLAGSLVVAGELRATENLIIEGSFDGQVFVPEHEVAVGRRGRLNGEVLARHITVLGRASGRLIADRVEIVPGATVEAEIVTERLVIGDGAFFQGVVDPTRTDAAFAVFRHERGKRGKQQ